MSSTTCAALSACFRASSVAADVRLDEEEEEEGFVKTVLLLRALSLCFRASGSISAMAALRFDGVGLGAVGGPAEEERVEESVGEEGASVLEP